MVVVGDIFGGGSGDEEGGAWGLGFECGLPALRASGVGVLGCLKRRGGFDLFVWLCFIDEGGNGTVEEAWFPFLFFHFSLIYPLDFWATGAAILLYPTN